MQRKVQIARFLLVVSFMFTIVFQFTHSIGHIIKTNSYITEHHDHDHFQKKTEVTKNVLEWKEHHDVLEHCFHCEVIPHSAILPDLIQFNLFEDVQAEKVQQLVVSQFTPLSHVYFSLRAPPAVI